MDVERDESPSIIRVDRITGDWFPANGDCNNLGEAENYAVTETEKRLPSGDKFLVLDADGEVLFDPG